MTKKTLQNLVLAIFILFSNLIVTEEVIASPKNVAINNKVLTVDRAIAAWPSGIPLNEKRPVLVFLPSWSGSGAVNASISAQNTNLVNEGYVTLAIGFDSNASWISDIELKTQQGLDKLCADTTIPANCNVIVLVGSSYGAAQNYWVIEHLHSNGYNSKVLGFLSEDGGYGAPGTLTNSSTGSYTRTGLANSVSYSVAMIENLGDTTFPVDECTWGNCGTRVLSNAHLARGDNNVFSICPSGGEHGTRGFANWNAWVVSAIKTMIHVTSGVPTFTGYTAPALTVSNACVNTAVLPGLSVSGINIVANGQPVRLRGINMGDPFWARNPAWYPNYSTADYANLSQNWHANVVRISIFPTQWKNMDHATLLAGLAQEVNAALNNGMYVIISYHVIGWPDGYYQSACCGNAADTYDSSMSVATSFWTQMAQTYGSDTRIIFDLWNEPVHDSADWVGADPNPYWPELKLAYESLIQTVRTNGAQNIVLATGNRWASWLVGIKDNPLTDSKVVYAYHKYSVNGLNTPAEWNKDTGGLIGVKPLIVSEWGYEDTDVTNPTWPGSQASYGDAFTQWMDSNNLSSLAWMYHDDWTPALLKSNGSLTTYGTFVKGYIADPASVHFAVIGDYGSAGQAELDVANRVKSWNPDFILTTGDNNYSSGEAATIDANIGQYYHDYISPYTGSYGAGAATNKFFPVLGNHDWVAANAQPYLNYFSLPGNERYYDFVKGPVHFFMIDSDPNEPDGNTSASVQATWLKNSLAASTSQWNIILLHHAPYSSGAHGSDAALQWPFETWGADAVLAGHDHTYERISKGGIPYFVNGLGGNPSIYGFGPPVAGSQLRYNSDYGAILVDATEAYINFQFITRSGMVIDSFFMGTSPTILVNSTLPTSRSIPVGTKATIFNTVINAGATTASGVTLSINPAPAGTFVYQQTNCATNAIIGSPNPSLDLAPNGVLCYILSFTPSSAFVATNVHIKAQASNAPSTNLLTGINTWLLRSTAVAGPDIIALTTTVDFHQVACSGANAFAVALSNVGAAATGDITAVANTGSATLPLSISINETNPGTGAIIGDNILQSVGVGANRTVAVFVTYNGCVTFDPAANRIFIEFRDASNNVVGSTSTAVSTNR